MRALIHNHDAKEMLYLGPDENITPVDINWVVRRADKRGYPLANAFMSSKPASGINHKARAARVATTACPRGAAPPAARARPNVARERAGAEPCAAIASLGLQPPRCPAAIVSLHVALARAGVWRYVRGRRRVPRRSAARGGHRPACRAGRSRRDRAEIAPRWRRDRAEIAPARKWRDGHVDERSGR